MALFGAAFGLGLLGLMQLLEQVPIVPDGKGEAVFIQCRFLRPPGLAFQFAAQAREDQRVEPTRQRRGEIGFHQGGELLAIGLDAVAMSRAQ